MSDPDRSQLARRTRRALAAALIVAVAVLAKWGAWRGHWVYDDWSFVLSGQDLVEGGPSRVSSYLLGNTNNALVYRPVPYLVSALDYAVWGRNPAGWRATTLGLHALAAVLLAGLALRITGKGAFALAAGLLFAAHPVTAPSANVPSFREETLAAVFLLAALHLALRASRDGGPWRWAGAAAFGLLGGLSKEVALLAPGFGVLALYMRDGRRTRVLDALRMGAVLSIPGVLYLLLRSRIAEKEAVAEAAGFLDPSFWSVYLGFLARAAREAFPFDWTAWGLPESVVATLPPGAPGLLGLAIAIALPGAAVCLLLRRQSPVTLGAALWALLATAPILALIRSTDGLWVSADEIYSAKRIYVASLGVSMLLAAPLLARARALRATGAVAAAAFVLVLATQSRLAMQDWIAIGAESRGCQELADGVGAALPAEGEWVFDSNVGFNCQLTLVASRVGRARGEMRWAVLRPDGLADPFRLVLPELSLMGDRPESAAAFLAGAPAIRIGAAPDGLACFRGVAPAEDLDDPDLTGLGASCAPRAEGMTAQAPAPAPTET